MKDFISAHSFLEGVADLLPVADRAKITAHIAGKDATEGERLTIRMGDIFALARQCAGMPIAEIEKLLDNPIYEVRMGAVNIMATQARSRKATPELKQELYDLYLRRHDRINTWSLIDASAEYVVGGYLQDKDRGILYHLAKSQHPYERRTALISTMHFIRKNDVKDTFAIAEILVGDSDIYVQKATGWMLREAGKKDVERLRAFLNKHAATMPRVTLRSAIERLDATEKAAYMSRKGKV